jgi:hypothetical protein
MKWNHSFSGIFLYSSLLSNYIFVVGAHHPERRRPSFADNSIQSYTANTVPLHAISKIKLMTANIKT